MNSISIKVENTEDGILYLLSNDKETVHVTCKDDCTLHVVGPRRLMESAIAGRGEETETESSFTDTQCKTKTEAVANVLEIMKKLIETA
jgi:hypothetical protein